jgi:isoleucyl-tRNA synthetase
VRLSRPRFYEVEGDDNRAAFATLHEVLTVTCRLLAPFAPFVSDWIHRELTGGESVHMAPYARPAAATAAHVDAELEAAMSAVRTLSTLGRAAREEAGIKVRQPLARMVCVVPHDVERGARALLPLLAAELNVKAIEFASSADALVTLEAKPNFRTLGKKFGKNTKLAAEAVTRLASAHLLAFERGEPLGITVGNETHLLDAEDVTIVRRAAGDLLVEEANGFVAAIDRTVTPELRREGIARELVSRVQKLRKDTRLQVSDRIVLAVWGDAEVEDAARERRQWIADEVLARELHVGRDGAAPPPENFDAVQAVELDGLAATIALTREH